MFSIKPINYNYTKEVENDLDDDSFEDFIQALKKMPNLIELALHFNNAKIITSNSLISLSCYFEKNY